MDPKADFPIVGKTGGWGLQSLRKNSCQNPLMTMNPHNIKIPQHSRLSGVAETQLDTFI